MLHNVQLRDEFPSVYNFSMDNKQSYFDLILDLFRQPGYSHLRSHIPMFSFSVVTAYRLKAIK